MVNESCTSVACLKLAFSLVTFWNLLVGLRDQDQVTPTKATRVRVASYD